LPTKGVGCDVPRGKPGSGRGGVGFKRGVRELKVGPEVSPYGITKKAVGGKTCRRRLVNKIQKKVGNKT